MKPLSVSQKANLDIRESAAWIARDNENAALRFYDAIKITCAAIQKQPGIGSSRWSNICPEIGFILFLPVQKFGNWLIFYVETSEKIVVIRVLHGARDLPSIFEE